MENFNGSMNSTFLFETVVATDGYAIREIVQAFAFTPSIHSPKNNHENNLMEMYEKFLVALLRYCRKASSSFYEFNIPR